MVPNCECDFWELVSTSNYCLLDANVNVRKGFDSAVKKCQNWVVVSNIFFTPIIEKIPILANIFQMGRNHHPEKVFNYILDCFVLLEEGFYFDSFVRYTPEV